VHDLLQESKKIKYEEFCNPNDTGRLHSNFWVLRTIGKESCLSTRRTFLVLTAVRQQRHRLQQRRFHLALCSFHETGEYMDHKEMKSRAKQYKVPGYALIPWRGCHFWPSLAVADVWDGNVSKLAASCSETLCALRNCEGFVIKCLDGKHVQAEDWVVQVEREAALPTHLTLEPQRTNYQTEIHISDPAQLLSETLSQALVL